MPAEVHRDVLFVRWDAHQPVAVAEILVREAELLRSKQKGDTVRSELLADEARTVFQLSEGVLQLTMTYPVVPTTTEIVEIAILLQSLRSSCFTTLSATTALAPLYLASLLSCYSSRSHRHRDRPAEQHEQPFRAAGKEPPKLHVLPSPYRFIIIPIVQFILDLSKKYPARSIIVVIPELVEDKWYEYFLHNQRGRLLEWVLLARGNERIFTVSAPWYVGQRT